MIGNKYKRMHGADPCILLITKIPMILLAMLIYDKRHGRVETRGYLVVDDVEWLRQRHLKWSSIRSIIKIHSIKESKNKL